uniref:Tyrosine specific protein phosphatases domain-containing protein n=1 Tax=Eutreptiella gymnastica TaxID=73025 RepID=A0A7S1NFZ0_9EUGL
MCVVGTEHLLLGLLLAAHLDGTPNGAVNVCCARGGSGVPAVSVEELCNALLDALNINTKDVAEIQRRYPNTAHEFGIVWGEPIKPAAKGRSSKGCRSSNMPECRTGQVQGTHWVNDSLLCGRSAGQMEAKELCTLITSVGVDTFVCLQTSYTEYGVNDYRATLRRLVSTGKLCPPHEVRFMHCPIEDFGVLSDSSLMALVGELQKQILTGDHVLYVHCMGGHGRTGTVLANLIMALDGVDFPTSMRTLQHYHRGRKSCQLGQCSLSQAELEDISQTKQAKHMQPIMARQKKIAQK